jgi:hypothetical protein
MEMVWRRGFAVAGILYPVPLTVLPLGAARRIVTAGLLFGDRSLSL